MSQQTESQDSGDRAGDQPSEFLRHPKTTKPPYYHPDTKTYQEEAGRFLHKRFVRHALCVIRFSKSYNGIITAIATLVIALFTAFLYCVSSQQADILRNQLRAMRNDQRPWIKVKVFASDPLDLTLGWGPIFIGYTVKNVGKSPAFRVRIGAWPYDGPPWSENYFTFQKQRCEQFVLGQAKDAEEQWVVFPDEERPWNGVHGFPGPGYTPADLKKVTHIDPKFGKTARITFAGCVDYVSPDDGQHHQTAFSFEVDELVMSLGELARSSDVSLEHRIPANRLLLQAYPSPPELTN